MIPAEATHKWGPSFYKVEGQNIYKWHHGEWAAAIFTAKEFVCLQGLQRLADGPTEFNFSVVFEGSPVPQEFLTCGAGGVGRNALTQLAEWVGDRRIVSLAGLEIGMGGGR